MLHSFWHKVPLVRILLAYVFGVLVATRYHPAVQVIILLFIAGVSAQLLLSRTNKSFRFRWIPGVFAMLSFAAAGMLLHWQQQPAQQPQHVLHVTNAKCFWVMVDEVPQRLHQFWRFRVRTIAAVTLAGKQIPADGYLLIQVADTAFETSYGMVLGIPAVAVKAPKPPLNPETFDYAAYLQTQHIFYQAMLTHGQVKQTSLNRGNLLFSWVYKVQQLFSGVLAKYLPGTTESGIARALLYGDDNGIDRETISAYANTGTLHVLAVSGMHVSLLFYVFGQLLGWLNLTRAGRVIKALLLLLLLWTYAVLCGLSPSILRATVMFSFVIAGTLLERKGNIYNTLAASGLVLLMADTGMLFNTGFQLSYLAVFGIVFFHPYINRWYAPNNWLARQVWQIVSVSLAAQLATTPVSLLYFHQFPWCFLLSNLIVIPLTTIILYGSMLLLLLSWWPTAAFGLGKLLFFLIGATNKTILIIGSLPYAYTDGLVTDVAQTLLLYTLLFTITAYLVLVQTQWFRLALFVAIGLMLLRAVHRYNQHKQQLLVVYAIKQGAAVGLYQGKHAQLLVNMRELSGNNARQQLRPHIWTLGITTADTLLLSRWVRLKLGNKTVLISGTGHPVHQGTVHVLILHKPLAVALLNRLHPLLVVCCGSLEKKEVNKVRNWCTVQNIPVYDVMESGAFQLSLQVYE